MIRSKMIFILPLLVGVTYGQVNSAYEYYGSSNVRDQRPDALYGPGLRVPGVPVYSKAVEVDRKMVPPLPINYGDEQPTTAPEPAQPPVVVYSIQREREVAEPEQAPEPIALPPPVHVQPPARELIQLPPPVYKQPPAPEPIPLPPPVYVETPAPVSQPAPVYVQPPAPEPIPLPPPVYVQPPAPEPTPLPPPVYVENPAPEPVSLPAPVYVEAPAPVSQPAQVYEQPPAPEPIPLPPPVYVEAPAPVSQPAPVYEQSPEPEPIPLPPPVYVEAPAPERVSLPVPVYEQPPAPEPIPLPPPVYVEAPAPVSQPAPVYVQPPAPEPVPLPPPVYVEAPAPVSQPAPVYEQPPAPEPIALPTPVYEQPPEPAPSSLPPPVNEQPLAPEPFELPSPAYVELPAPEPVVQPAPVQPAKEPIALPPPVYEQSPAPEPVALPPPVYVQPPVPAPEPIPLPQPVYEQPPAPVVYLQPQPVSESAQLVALSEPKSIPQNRLWAYVPPVPLPSKPESLPPLLPKPEHVREVAFIRNPVTPSINYPDPSYDVTTEQPTVAPITNPPSPVTYPPEPVTYPPEPVTYPPAPVTYPPAPVTYPPAPVTYPPAPVTYAPVTYPPAPVTYPPAPVTYPPAPVTYPPAPVTYQPNPVTIPSGYLILDYQCQGDGYYAVANECDTFVECEHGKAYKYLCPDGLHFNPEAKRYEYPCAYPSEVKCVAGAVEQTPKATDQCPNQYGYYAIKDGDCSKYIMCQEGAATVMECPLGLVFNSQISSCDWPSNVPECSPAVFKDFICPDPPKDEDGLIDPNDGLPNRICYKCLFKVDKCSKFKLQCIQSETRLRQITTRANELDNSNSSELSNYNYGSHSQDGPKVKPEDYIVEDSVVMVVDPSLDYDSSEESENMEPVEPEVIERNNTPDGMKPFACRKCHLTFGRRDKLIKHEMRHGPLSPGKTEYDNDQDSHDMVVNVNPFSNLMTSPTQLHPDSSNAEYDLPRVPDHISGESSFMKVQKNTSVPSKVTSHSPPKQKAVTNKNRPKNIKCHQCPKRFSSLDSYKTHVSIAHIGSRIFQCKICFKKFPRKRELDRHAALHSGMKPFSCSQCDKKFTKKDKLDKHEQTHECLVVNMPCIECGATFEKKPDLVAHIKSHFTENFDDKLTEAEIKKEEDTEFNLEDNFYDLET
ncbi:hypothetical protein SFRURICE_004625 [Spodoptera frugiperda]|nr:hypothetical protein SFRURICE_004625 [Spodoptera frugiperda]